MPELFFIYGPPGSGKSTLGRRLAERLALPFADLDALIAADAGRSVTAIFAAEGEAAFRAREARALADLVAGGRDAVVALGGGALLDPASRALAERHGVVLCLHAPPGTLAARAARAPGSRPLLDASGAGGTAAARLAALLERRAAHYAAFARQLDAASDDCEAKVAEAQILCGAFRVGGMSTPCDVRIGAGLLSERQGLPAAMSGRDGAVLVVADTNTAALHGQTAAEALREAGLPAELLVIPAGEAHKGLETVVLIWRGLLRAGIDRGGTVMAVGGGVVGDLAGFAAATWMRGVRWVAVPTSLLAMVDSSLGGKTAFDLPEGKNLVGAFHAPARVVADTATLRSLPAAELRCGLAEMVKHGVIAGPALFGRLEALAAKGPLAPAGLPDELVARAMAVKIGIIEEDPREQGPRAALNLGHTIGHAIEAASGFALRHGEAVAIGLVAETRLAERIGLAASGLADRLAALLERLGLPVSPPAGLDADACLAALRRDKKRRQGKARLALPVRLGEVRCDVAVEETLLKETFAA
jgi:shikimate kinase/3-dehydroquinate synthase